VPAQAGPLPKGEGEHRHGAGKFLNPRCNHRFGVIGGETDDNRACRMAQSAADDSPSPGGEGRGEGGCQSAQKLICAQEPGRPGGKLCRKCAILRHGKEMNRDFGLPMRSLESDCIWSVLPVRISLRSAIRQNPRSPRGFRGAEFIPLPRPMVLPCQSLLIDQPGLGGEAE